MKNIFSAILVLSLAFEVNAQTTYQKLYGGSDDDLMYKLAKTHDGGYIFSGETQSFGASLTDIYILRTDVDGNLLWSKLYRGISSELAICVNETSDHGFVLSGATKSFGAGGDDGLIMKIDSTGNVQWSRTYGGPQEDIIFAAIQTSDGGYIAAGHTASFGAGSMDMLVIRTNAIGDTLWTRIIGGAGWENATDIIETSDNNFVLCGRTGSFGSTFLKIYLGKLNASGDSLWSVQYGGSGEEESQSLIEALNGDYMVLGSSNSFSATNLNAYLSRFDTAGNLLWSKIYGGPKPDAMYELVNMSDSGFAMDGFTDSFGEGHRGTDSSNAWVIRTDMNGDTLWTRTYGGEKMEEIFGLVKNADEGLSILSFSSSFGNDSLDCYLIRTDSLGNSGCNETPSDPFVIAPPTIVNRVSPQINSGVTVGTALFSVISPPSFQNTLCFSVGIDEADVYADEVLLFPNPATNELAIGNWQLAINEIEIYNDLGQQVYNSSLITHHSTLSIDVSRWNAGIYFVILKSDKEIIAKKFVVSR